MNLLTATLILAAVAITFFALWAYIVHDYRRFNREHPRPEPEPVEDIDFAEALRCRGGRLSPQVSPSATPLLDAFRERR